MTHTFFNARTLISTTTAAALFAIATSAAAFTPQDNPDIRYVNTEVTAPSLARSHALPDAARIAVARVELGRLIPVPQPERFRWSDMEKRTGDSFELLTPGAYLDAVPEIDFDSYDSDNKLDEMRLASLDEGYDYILIYGMGEDAYAGSFARRPISRTGFSVTSTGALYRTDDAKAVLVETRTGHVLGAVTAPVTDRHITDLSDEVAELIPNL
jgi:hypothetical protein